VTCIALGRSWARLQFVHHNELVFLLHAFPHYLCLGLPRTFPTSLLSSWVLLPALRQHLLGISLQGLLDPAVGVGELV
jgi:hypothetical protein